MKGFLCLVAVLSFAAFCALAMFAGDKDPVPVAAEPYLAEDEDAYFTPPAQYSHPPQYSPSAQNDTPSGPYGPPAGYIPSAQYGSPAPYGPPVAQPKRQQLQQLLADDRTIVPWLLQRAASGDEPQRAAATSAVLALSTLAVPDLIKGLSDEDDSVGMAAASLLGHVGKAPDVPLKDVIPALMKIAKDETKDEDVREMAGRAICEILCTVQGQPMYQPIAG